MPLLHANGLALMVETAGEGPPLLFIGGTGWDLRRTRAPLGPPLAERFHVALYDQRGQGRSAKPPGPYAMADFAADAVGVLDALGWRRAHVVGYSFGGMVAQEVAIRWPERVDRLVLAATSAGGHGGASYPIQRLLDLPPLERARCAIEVADRRFSRAFQAAHPDIAAVRISARAAEQSRYMDEPGARAGLAAQLDARSRHDAHDRLRAVAAPTLIVAGVHDGQAPEPLSRAMLAEIRGAQMITVDGAHDFITECSAFFAETVKFLEGRL